MNSSVEVQRQYKQEIAGEWKHLLNKNNSTKGILFMPECGITEENRRFKWLMSAVFSVLSKVEVKARELCLRCGVTRN